MKQIIEKSDIIVLRSTEESDLNFVVDSERGDENANYVVQWSREEHSNALQQEDIMHLIVEDKNTHRAVGYVIIAGLKSSNHSIELKRLVICDKGKGLGRETLRLIKNIAFKKLKAHRLWLDVFYKNYKAKKLYNSEGFTEEGILRECFFHNNQYESLIVMSILEHEVCKQA